MANISFVVLALSLVTATFPAGRASRAPNTPPSEEAIDGARTGPRYLNSWAVEVVGGKEMANDLARKHGFVNRGQIGNIENHYYFVLGEQTREVTKEITSLMHVKTAAMEKEEGVGFIEQQHIQSREKKAYNPPSDPGWRRQWSLLNTGQTNGPPGLDLNVEPAWIQGITGKGVVVSFVDDGLYWKHSDLRQSYDATASYDFAHHDRFPNPDPSSGEPNSHGTNCAGIVGMVENSLCGVGVAYGSHIGGLKVDLETSSDAVEASALGYKDNHIHIYSNSWGPSDNGFIVEGPGPLAKKALFNGVTKGRNGKGNIYVFAAGNGGVAYDSCAADGYTSSIYTIGVGSADQYGSQADYDENCSGKMAVTFSYNSDTFNRVTYNQLYTTTLQNECVDDFTGTSASTPLASGGIALVLQANPDLTWRDIQYLIVYTSNRNLLTGDDWITNGAGLSVSHHFGFGAIDAEAMVTRARNWTTVPEQHSITMQIYSQTRNVYTKRIITFVVTESNFTDGNYIAFLEHVVLTLSLTIKNRGTGYSYDDYNTEYANDYLTGDFDALYEWLSDAHPRRGDIKIELTSPQGTKSVLLPYRDYDFINEEGYDNWPFMSVHYWGENPLGTWTLTVIYRSVAGYVHMSGHNITFYGVSSTPTAVSTIPQHCHPYCAGGCSAGGPNNCDSCNNFRVASTLECVDECPSGTVVYKSYCVSRSPAPSPSLHEPLPTATVYMNRSIQPYSFVHISSYSMEMTEHQTITPLMHSSQCVKTSLTDSKGTTLTSVKPSKHTLSTSVQTITPLTHSFQYVKTSLPDPKGTTLTSVKPSKHTLSTSVPTCILKSSKPQEVVTLTSMTGTSSKMTIVQDMNISLSIVTTSSKCVVERTDNANSSNKKKIVVAISITAAILLCIVLLVGASIVAVIFIAKRKKKGKFTRLNSEEQDQINLVET